MFNGRPLGPQVGKKLVKVFDKDSSGTIDMREYCILHKFLTEMQALFFAADTDRSGTLDEREVFQAITNCGFQVSFPTVAALCKKFDITGRKMYDFSVFLFMVAHLAHCRSIFEWNDTARTGQIALTYDSLCHIGTDLLS